jgi:hypothetical protein
MKLLETLGGRKFVFAVGVVLLFFVLVLFGQTDAEKLESIAIWALAIFSVANVGQKVIK